MATNKSKLNRMSPAAKKAGLGDKVDQLITLVNELRTDLNALRTDFRAHDHGAAYAQQTVRLGAAAGTFSGTAESSSSVTSPAVDALN